MQNTLTAHLQVLSEKLSGELYFDELIKAIYATDASIYRMLPEAVAYPKNKEDIKLLIEFAKKYNTSLIPRTAGTSLAGQCVGKGIVVDVSRHFTNILSFDEKARTVTVQPGVIRDELNNYLKPYGLFFSPITSTSNRAMIGGMVGNNSSGTTSIQYGVTRDKVIEIQALLSDGNEAVFGEVTYEVFHKKAKAHSLEGHIYRSIYGALNSKGVQKEIEDKFPKPEIHRRNTGYAIDELIKSNIFSDSESDFNMCQLLTGSEGTLAFSTQITLKLDELPPQESVMVAAHFNSIENCLNAVELTMAHNLYTCEMMDKTILDCTKNNRTQQENRRFIEGDPKAILMCEVRANTKAEVEVLASQLVESIKASGLSYAYPKLVGEDINRANTLRSAGLGLLGNIVGDKKSAACIEDTAVALPDLSNYISEFTALMKGYNQEAIYYAHAGAGELHLRPILNLKTSEDIGLFRKITTDVAHLVKKYGGSMSGEHGDGIVRAEFIPLMIGDINYQILKRIKQAFDPDNIFNPGKIVDALPMDKSLRYQPDRNEPEIKTLMDFSPSLGILRETEKCNGSGDCRKLPEFGGVMCPSYRATRHEKDTTRARANALREFLTNSDKDNKFDYEELKTVFDLCLSCKACASECPSSVDVATLKAEFQYQYQKANGVSWRTKMFAYNNKLNRFGSAFPGLTNFMFSNGFTSSVLKRTFGIAKERQLPLISKRSFKKVFKRLDDKTYVSKPIKTVYLFNDEFLNYLDTPIGIDAFELLIALNYQVKVVNHVESGRTFLSKGLLEQAKKVANTNVSVFKDLVTAETPLIGIEPSAILGFKDEYLKLTDDRTSAEYVSKHVFLIEEFIQQEIKLGNIKPEQFTSESKTIKFHGHCHQKSMGNQLSSFDVLNFPKNYKVTIIPSGCCGMAGSFGYEKEHYDVSMNVGEQTLFPAVRKASTETIISANGTSCRHQIKDGTGREAKHPVTILREALI
ncbi:FAD-linked oxidase C-terminal domain-containing protein [Aestuariibaculum sp. YM273]|uniref:FAD-binding and (Fe-S)-binding domain-containing protein n=1 Tax=Aestuariibaculum sp. YM273 TaxID=3070659 RepID=UPI0027DDE73B|nr:FAD-binding and (Fe-S)-binding domain-containing protein [Aestuariibaculum sp. YM273]WMI64664.1 FAD-linked oxidase C-terminal domain-containing protein [Aestuariibaculum sp. YM273]